MQSTSLRLLRVVQKGIKVGDTVYFQRNGLILKSRRYSLLFNNSQWDLNSTFSQWEHFLPLFKSPVVGLQRRRGQLCFSTTSAQQQLCHLCALQRTSAEVGVSRATELPLST